jgi:hypothetical protein
MRSGEGPFTGKPGDAVKDTEPAPADEAIVERLVRAIASRRIFPLRAVTDHVDDALTTRWSSTRGTPCDSGKCDDIRSSGVRSEEINPYHGLLIGGRESHPKPN